MSSLASISRHRKGKGRQKIDMAKIQDARNLQVSFSKRHHGIFKKASELCTLTGAEAGVVVFSPGNKAYSFGNPNIESVTNKFLNQEEDLMPNQQGQPIIQQDELDQLAHIENLIKEERMKGERLTRIRRAIEKEKLIPPEVDGIEELNHEQCVRLKGSFERFKSDLESRMKRPMLSLSSTAMVPPYYANRHE